MSKRLQILIPDSEFREIQRVAPEKRLTVAAWVRQVLQHARRQEPHGDVDKKIEAVRTAFRHAFPTGDLSEMLADIERGYLGKTTP